MDLNLKNRTALVTGGSQGIGLGIAQALAAEGAHVIIASRNENNLESARAQIFSRTPGAKVSTHKLDVSQPKTLQEEAAKLAREYKIDILVNNVGGPPAGPILSLKEEAWDLGYERLLRSVITLSRVLVHGMQERGWGRILTITSTAAKEMIANLPVSATFRAGLSAWAKVSAKELGRSGVLVNNLLPGPIATARLDELKIKSPDFYNSMEKETAVGRLGTPDEIGRVAAFLCSDANSFITGTDVLVDGGYTKAL